MDTPTSFFEVLRPKSQRVPFVYNSPHSGRVYPASFLALSRLDERTIRRSEDTFVDELLLGAVERGAPLLRAHFPRAWLDVNREPYELDPKMFVGDLPNYCNVRSVRAAGGLGTIARVVAEHEEIYARPIEVKEGLTRIESVYRPYHETLRRLVAETHSKFGMAVLVDGHSMPSNVKSREGRARPDVVVGDRHGTSCAPEISESAAAFMKARGYAVTCNKPYAGGFITEHYGRPKRGLHALQLEVNRGLYMDEQRFEKTAGFSRLQRDLGELAATLSRVAIDLAAFPEAAE
ncbi:MAG: N-formylglutamate amidohydrolase [Bauldia sp.]|nr:N-formylglutamate amidohydrolase [Bauldia sp.]